MNPPINCHDQFGVRPLEKKLIFELVKESDLHDNRERGWERIACGM